AARRHEMSIRAALGAGRLALMRQAFIECCLLSCAGATLGLGFAIWGSRLVAAQMTQDSMIPLALPLNPDWRILGVAITLTLLTAFLFGLIPAWRASGASPAVALQQNPRTQAGTTGATSKVLTVVQFALSLVLVFGAGLLVRTFQNLGTISTGFEQEKLL